MVISYYSVLYHFEIMYNFFFLLLIISAKLWLSVYRDMNKFKITPKKEIKSIFILRGLYCFLWSLAVLFTIYFITSAISGGQHFTLKHVFIFLLCSIPFSIIYAFAVEKLGSRLGGTGRSNRKVTPRELHSADLAKARFSKAKGQFKEALNIINEVVEKDPEFPDALLLKAQILWEGFENRELALKYLNKVIELVQEDDLIRRWAVNYYHEIIKYHRIEK